MGRARSARPTPSKARVRTTRLTLDSWPGWPAEAASRESEHGRGDDSGYRLRRAIVRDMSGAPADQRSTDGWRLLVCAAYMRGGLRRASLLLIDWLDYVT
jgi:hypothetical protein